MADKLLKVTRRLFERKVVTGVRRFAEERRVVLYNPFRDAKEKNKTAYLDMLRLFEKNEPKRRGHVEFIYAALRHMKEFGVHKDLDTYKSLLEVLPKGRFVPTNLLQSEYMHYPKQQQCAIDLLEQMEDNGVMPDFEMEDILITVFGKRGYPLRKYWRMMYWMPKFKNLSPWRLPPRLPDDSLELATLAVRRITGVDDDMGITVFDTADVEASVDRTWIVSAQSPTQRRLLREESERRARDPSVRREPLMVRGTFNVRLRDRTINYFTLCGTYEADEPAEQNLDDVSDLNFPNVMGSTTLPSFVRSVHEQDDGVILAVCATGTSSRDSLLSWIRLLERNENPGLEHLAVAFQLVSPPSEIILPETLPERR